MYIINIYIRRNKFPLNSLSDVSKPLQTLILYLMSIFSLRPRLLFPSLRIFLHASLKISSLKIVCKVEIFCQTNMKNASKANNLGHSMDNDERDWLRWWKQTNNKKNYKMIDDQ